MAGHGTAKEESLRIRLHYQSRHIDVHCSENLDFRDIELGFLGSSTLSIRFWQFKDIEAAGVVRGNTFETESTSPS